MPTYDYQCAACEHTWEEFQSITAKPKRKCPECGKLKAKRLIGTGAGVIFKGSGFYQTDYRSSSYQKGADAAKQAQESAAKSAEGASKKSEGGSSGSSTSEASKKSSD